MIESSEILASDALDRQTAATPFPAQTGCCHAAVRERELRGNIEPQWGCGRDRIIRQGRLMLAALGLELR